MKPEIKVTQTFDNVAAIRRAARKLTEQDVFIGIPEDKAAREAAGDTGISNAYLGYIHEHGVPEKNIPARPALIPGIEDIQGEAAGILKDAAAKALDGNAAAVDTALNKIGILGQNAVRARFVNNDWTPLSDKTLDRRKKISETVNKKGKTVRKMGKSRRERGAINPLIDTSGLRKSCTYVIRKKSDTAPVVK
jgi:hypothetical protein